MADVDDKKYARETDVESSGSDSISNDFSHIKTKALLAKIDLIILPGVSFLYLLSFLDRSNVGNAKLEGLTTDVKMTTNQYLTGLTLFFVGYILFEVPCNIILKRTTPKLWLPTLTAIWGVVATLLGVIHNLAGFDTARFFLGIAEGGLFPGVVFYLSYWYTRAERQYRVALFFSAASLAGAFGGILAWGIAHMDGVGGYAGWRWIFILEGIFTFVVGLSAYFWITSYPSTAKWLSEDEKSFLQYRLKADSDAAVNEGFSWGNVAKVFKDPKCWLYCAAFHTMSLPLYTLSLFLPTIIKDLGYTSSTAQLYTIPPYALAAVVTVVIAMLAEKTKRRAPYAIAASAFGIIGYIILLANSDLKTVTSISKGKTTHTQVFVHPGISYAAVFFCAAGIYPATALALGWPAVNVSGQTKRATAGALQITIGNLGAVIGTQIYREHMTPRFVVGNAVALTYLALNIVVTCSIWAVLNRENKKRAAELANAPIARNAPWDGDDDSRFIFQT